MEILELIDNEHRPGELKPHPCTIPGCSKSFDAPTWLGMSEFTPTKDNSMVKPSFIRPYVCDELNCEKSFIQRSALKVHLSAHSGERPHQCEYENCKKTFCDSSSLARHRRIHAGKRPYKCPFDGCNKYFARKVIMRKHQKQVHHSSTTKRAFLQWRPLNEILIHGGGNRKKKSDKSSWRPLDEILQDGKLLSQQLLDSSKVAVVEEENNAVPASPVPSEQSATTLDEDMIYSPMTSYQHNNSNKMVLDNWYPSSFYHRRSITTTTTTITIPTNYYHHTTNTTVLSHHHHSWLPSLCNEHPYYPPITMEDANTPIFFKSSENT